MSAKNKEAGAEIHSPTQQPEAHRLVRMGNDLRRLLLFHQQIGIGSYPMLEGLKTANFCPRHSSPSVPPLLPERKKIKTRTAASNVSASTQNGTEVAAVKAIFQNIADCDQCSLNEGGALGLPAKLPVNVRLMIIGDYCLDAASKEQTACFFGRAEDEMLTKMIGALGLKQEDVYITNCIKCCCSNGEIPSEEQLHQCQPYLTREIAAVKPAVICAMGEISARTVLGKNEPVVRLRGTFRRYRYYEEHPVEVMVTFHPRFLLAHEEMKRATWNDLQQIQKRFLKKS